MRVVLASALVWGACGGAPSTAPSSKPGPGAASAGSIAGLHSALKGAVETCAAALPNGLEAAVAACDAAAEVWDDHAATAGASREGDRLLGAVARLADDAQQAAEAGTGGPLADEALAHLAGAVKGASKTLDAVPADTSTKAYTVSMDADGETWARFLDGDAPGLPRMVDQLDRLAFQQGFGSERLRLRTLTAYLASEAAEQRAVEAALAEAELPEAEATARQTYLAASGGLLATIGEVVDTYAAGGVERPDVRIALIERVRDAGAAWAAAHGAEAARLGDRAAADPLPEVSVDLPGAPSTSTSGVSVDEVGRVVQQVRAAVDACATGMSSPPVSAEAAKTGCGDALATWDALLVEVGRSRTGDQVLEVLARVGDDVDVIVMSLETEHDPAEPYAQLQATLLDARSILATPAATEVDGYGVALDGTPEAWARAVRDVVGVFDAYPEVVDRYAFEQGGEPPAVRSRQLALSLGRLRAHLDALVAAVTLAPASEADEAAARAAFLQATGAYADTFADVVGRFLGGAITDEASRTAAKDAVAAARATWESARDAELARTASAAP